MLVNKTLIIALLLFSNFSNAQDWSSFKLVDAKGKKTSEKKLEKAMTEADLVFFGEEHNNMVAHHLSRNALVSALMSWQGGAFALEMFESDQQQCVDSLNAGLISMKEFEARTRTWPNFSDYRFQLDTALALGANIVASNIPRPFASALYHGGRDSLKAALGDKPELGASIDFPIDFDLSQYKQLEEMAVHMGGKNFTAAQAYKDATMAKFILSELKNGKKVFHLNGCYHSDFHQGIMWYVQKKRPETEIVAISVVSSKELKWNPEWKNKADFIFIIQEDFPTSY
jgi:uncharacterized iron-regulated protein